MKASFARWSYPVLAGVLLLVVWQLLVSGLAVPPYVMPGPLAIGRALIDERAALLHSTWITMSIALAALCLAVVSGLLLAVLFVQSRALGQALFPYAVVMQVTPVVAIAPLLIIWTGDAHVALLICAWLVAFFPILSNTTLGLRSADAHLLSLFRLYRATRWQTLWYLQLPAATPYFLGGLRISGGLSLVGAVVAEFVAGTGGTRSGLASRILDAGYRLAIPEMFAALLLISACGLVIFGSLSLISHLALRRWHESAMPREL
ncbi:ABC transporter permease [Solimonas marina]|uniref:ABC transporter permease n=1 Tax=Solimonas marina TaxID=2714601 RepID=A0A969WG17_9GAMM|nr:ABC transporter permease [Solimonas marina]NKF24631.1 ABC transporter permease [Solimonas marina]